MRPDNVTGAPGRGTSAVFPLQTQDDGRRAAGALCDLRKEPPDLPSRPGRPPQMPEAPTCRGRHNRHPQEALPHAHQRRKAAAQLRHRPRLLTGEGAQGSPAVISLINGLLNAGAAQIVLPPCAVCGLAKPLKWRDKDARCCRGCYEASRQEPCSCCGQTKHVATRTHEGEPLCYPCMRRDPANMSTCFLCGRLWPWTVKDADGHAICGTCWRPPVTTCSVCGQQRPCHYSTSEAPRCAACGDRSAHAPCSRCSAVRAVFVRLDNGDGLCESCARRREPCVDCGRTMRVYGRIDAGPLCTICYRKHPSSRRHCVQCGTHERLHHFGLCAACAAPRQLHAALMNPSGDLRPELEPLFSALAESKASSLLLWLSHQRPKQILRTLAEGTGPVTHATLDEMPESKAVTYLRAALVATDVLPARDEQLASLERWLSVFLQQVGDRQERALISRFATSGVCGPARGAALSRAGSAKPCGTTSTRRLLCNAGCADAEAVLRPAIRLRSTNGWLSPAGSTPRPGASCCGPLHEATLSRCTFPRGVRRAAPSDSSKRTSAGRSANAFSTTQISPCRTGWPGCLVVLYGQPVSRVAPLTTDKILAEADGVQLQLGSRPVEIPEPLGFLLLELVRSRQAFAVLGQNGQGPWLFPGGRAGQAMTASHLTVRLNRLGIRARASRNTALLDLAA